jgi:hypothetical protein
VLRRAEPRHSLRFRGGHWDCDGGINQRWTLNADGTIVGVESNLYLGVRGAGTANGILVDIATCAGGGDQRRSRTGAASLSTRTLLLAAAGAYDPARVR